MPTGPYSKWEYNEQTEKFHPNRNWRSYFEQQVMDYFQQVHPNCKIQTQFTHKKQKKLGPYLVDGFCNHCNTVFEAMGCFFHFVPVKRKNRFSSRTLKEDWSGENVTMIEESTWRDWGWMLKRSGRVNGRSGGAKTQIELKTFSSQIIPSNHRRTKTRSLRKLNVENCLVLSIVVLKFRRISIITLKTFLQFSRTVKLDKMILGTIWKSLQNATNYYPDPEKCSFPVSS